MIFKNDRGWTGGQYSLVRLASGLYLLFVSSRFLFSFTGDQTSWLIVPALVSFVSSILFGIGLFTKPVVALLVLSFLLLGEFSLGIVLIFYLFIPPRPLGSLDGYFNENLGEQLEWDFPRHVYPIIFLLWVIAASFDFFMSLNTLFALCSIGVFFIDLSQTKDEINALVLFYDGNCGLCHNWVKLMMLEQPDSPTKFSPLQGTLIDDYFSESEKAELPDSMIVIDNHKKPLLKSDGVVFLLKQLGGLWRVSGILLGLIPAALRDPVYDFIASVRLKIFKTPNQLCPIMPERLAERFVD